MIRLLLRWVLRAALRVTVEGDAHALRRGHALVVANHQSLLDGVLLGLFLPGRPLVVVAREVLQGRLTRLMLRAIPYVVLEPSRPLGVKRLIQQIRDGRTVVIFPEGRATATGTVMKTYDAAGVIASRCGAPVVPVRIEGTLGSMFSAVTGNYRKTLFPRVTVRVHAPLEAPAAPPLLPPRERRRRLGDAMLRVVQSIVADVGPSCTLFEAFLDAASQYGWRTRIVEDVRQRPESYADLMKSALALGRLACRITREGEIVGVMMPNVSASIALVLGLTAMRRIPGMLNYTAGPDALTSACTAACIRTLITSRRFVQLAKLEPALRALAQCEVHYVEDLRRDMGVRDVLWLVRAMLAPRFAVPRAEAQDTAVVLFTSGSEARPKGVALSHRGILANVAQMRAVIDFGPNDKYLNALPLYHTFGLIACSILPLVSGTRLLLYTNPLHYRVVPELAYTRDCTYIFGTSTFLGHYGKHAHPYDFYRTRVAVCGGEKLNDAVAELWLRKFGLRIMEGYGATECGPAMALNTPLCYRPGTVGRFMPGIEYRLVAVAGIERGSALHVRSPNLMKGYYFYEQPGQLQPPRSEVGPGWYNTGDVVDVDDEGYVSILGRVKRFAKIAGEMVSLELVERIAYEASSGCKHAATVEELPGAGESTVLFTTDATLDRIGLHHAARRLGARDLAVARRVIHVPALPLLGSGKTDYVTLKEQIVRTA